MGMCLGALGTQTGGSLVRPSTYCGVATCKPTFGRLSTEGIVPVSYHLDHPGPMARTVADLAIMWQSLLGTEEAFSLRQRCAPRLGLLERYAVDEADERSGRRPNAALERLRAAAHGSTGSMCPANSRKFSPCTAGSWRSRRPPITASSSPPIATQYGPMIAALLDEGLAISGVDYAAALAWQRDFRGRAAAASERLRRPGHALDATPRPRPRWPPPARRKFQAPWSLAGLPVVSIPCGLAADGMPAAVQLIGRAATSPSCCKRPHGANGGWTSASCRRCGRYLEPNGRRGKMLPRQTGRFWEHCSRKMGRIPARSLPPCVKNWKNKTSSSPS